MRPAWDATAAAAALARLAATPVTPLDKGFAGLREPVAAAGLVGSSLDDPAFSTPLLVLRERAIDHNVAVLADWTARHGVLLAPHAKTTMSPELFVRQLRAGAWGLTAASPLQAAVFAAHGARRVLIANEVVDATGVATLARLLGSVPELELLAYADDPAGAAALAPLAAFGDRFGVLVELGVPGGRAGLRDDAAIPVVLDALRDAGLRVAGFSCFEGPLGDDRAAVAALFARVREAAVAFAGPAIASAGGSHHFDLAAAELAAPGVTVVVRSGASIVHDHGTYLHDSPAMRGADLEPFVPAIEVRAGVLSRPEPERAILDAGRRDVSADTGLPIPLDLPDAELTALNDQHAFVDLNGAVLEVGELVRLGISHPCTTLDKWRLGVLADDDDRVTGIAHTFF